MRIAVIARQFPRVGKALNWQGHPQSQLQLAISGPRMRHSMNDMAASLATTAQLNISDVKC
jgi:hypothetical protein